MARMTDRSFQMMARYLPGSKTPLDPLFSPNSFKNKYGGDWTKPVIEKGPKAAAMLEEWRNEVGHDVDTFAKFLAKFPKGKRS